MKTVPLAMGLGNIPLRTSKNPVLGVFRHHCGSIATVHAPKGKKAHLRYLLCDECKCDQASGEEYQEKIKRNMFISIEDLEQSEQQKLTPQALHDDVSEDLTDTLTEKALPPIVPDTAPIVAQTVNVPLKKAPIEKAEPLTEKVTVKTLPPKPLQKEVNPKNIGLAAVVGAVFGGLLALVM